MFKELRNHTDPSRTQLLNIVTAKILLEESFGKIAYAKTLKLGFNFRWKDIKKDLSSSYFYELDKSFFMP